MNLARRELSETRGGIIGWSLAVVAVIALYVPFYPSLGGSDMMDVYLRLFPAELARLFGLDLLATGAGYVHATFHGMMGYLLLAIAASAGAAQHRGRRGVGKPGAALAYAITWRRSCWEASVALLIWLAIASAASFWRTGPERTGRPGSRQPAGRHRRAVPAGCAHRLRCPLRRSTDWQPAAGTGLARSWRSRPTSCTRFRPAGWHQLAGRGLALALVGNDPLSTGFDLRERSCC